jgi:hypothetical protein
MLNIVEPAVLQRTISFILKTGQWQIHPRYLPV